MIKDNIKAMDAYSVPVQFDGIKLNQNESAEDVPPAVKDEILRRLKKSAWNRYPVMVPEALIRKISEYTSFPVEGIMVGSGSNELIQSIIYGCCNSGDCLLTVEPTFSVYQRAADVMKINRIAVPLNEDLSFDIPALLGRLDEVKLVILASPNNPTGTVPALADVREIAQRLKGLLVVDEAYYEFHGESAQQLIRSCPNVVVLRTFSKALRGAGLRLGYLLGTPAVVAELKKVKLPFSVGMFQQVAGEVLLENAAGMQGFVAETVAERERLFAALSTIQKIRPVRSRANFILFEVLDGSAEDLYRDLCRQGVLVRFYDCPGPAGMLRVSVGTAGENDTFLGCLAGCLRRLSEGQGEAPLENPVSLRENELGRV